MQAHLYEIHNCMLEMMGKEKLPLPHQNVPTPQPKPQLQPQPMLNMPEFSKASAVLKPMGPPPAPVPLVRITLLHISPAGFAR